LNANSKLTEDSIRPKLRSVWLVAVGGDEFNHRYLVDTRGLRHTSDGSLNEITSVKIPYNSPQGLANIGVDLFASQFSCPCSHCWFQKHDNHQSTREPTARDKPDSFGMVASREGSCDPGRHC
jgi:hypothetical protein